MCPLSAALLSEILYRAVAEAWQALTEDAVAEYPYKQAALPDVYIDERMR